MKPTMTFFWVEKKNLTDSRFRLAHFLLPQHYTQIPIYLKHHSRTKVQACKTRGPLDNCCHRLLQSEKKKHSSRGSFSKSRQAGAVVITQAAVPAPCSPTPHAVVTRYDVFFVFFLKFVSFLFLFPVSQTQSGISPFLR